MHSGGKSNNCKDCDYALISASDFRKHLEMHGGEK